MTRDAPRAYGIFAKLINLIVVFVIHVVVAPVVAAFAFIGLLLTWLSIAPSAHPPDIIAVGLLLAFMISFYVALAPAVAMGAIFAVWQTFIGRVRALGAAATGLVIGALTWVMLATEIDVQRNGSSLFALCLLTGMITALCAWLPARSFVTAADAR